MKAALEIARSEGLQALTIRRLAADLGASRMALYRHVADKDALVGLVLDAVAAHEVVPEGVDDGPWERRLRLLADTIRREMTAYPGILDAFMTRPNQGPGGLHVSETILRILADAGLDEPTAARYFMIFIDVVLGRLHRELHGDPVGERRTAGLVAAAAEHDDVPHLRAASPHLRATTSADVFHAELDMLIEMIGARARRS